MPRKDIDSKALPPVELLHNGRFDMKRAPKLLTLAALALPVASALSMAAAMAGIIATSGGGDDSQRHLCPYLR